MKKQESPVLVVERVSRSYGSLRALDAVSFTLYPGELVALLGENGAGKTTTLRLIAGLLSPDAGLIQGLGGHISWGSSEMKQLVGYLAEEPFLYETLSGFEFLELVGALHRLPRSICRQRAEALLARLNLREVAQQRIQSYSQGMRRRLALCSVLLHYPRLLLLDEPLNGLDPASVREVKRLLSELCAEGSAVLVSTHLLDVAERLCSRAIILSRGRVIADGALDELRRQASQGAEASLEAVFFALTAADGEAGSL
ncbi:MAG: ABC transporter ATP-binding protein [Thermogemmatispora sp.]|uniref:ABC transporter ATP-binding protein n=1 Tax=Thermogemmatispora sp. TaxID=1968838 RepID=UPI00261063CA|nr:ABC transporter ATP-binding protein [Thermogemmatispora sp.]MBX5459212.1 ABC transporter ATP-binding protein [Thermogemmatispora sp.]